MSKDTSELEKLVASLNEQIKDHEERIQELEEQRSNTPETPTDSPLDNYDEQAIQYLKELDRERITLPMLKNAYNQAGMRNERKIKNRIKALENLEILEGISGRKWRLVDK